MSGKCRLNDSAVCLAIGRNKCPCSTGTRYLQKSITKLSIGLEVVVVAVRGIICNRSALSVLFINDITQISNGNKHIGNSMKHIGNSHKHVGNSFKTIKNCTLCYEEQVIIY